MNKNKYAINLLKNSNEEGISFRNNNDSGINESR